MMRYRSFGTTGWEISELALGTVALGVPAYGIRRPDEVGLPDREAAEALLLSGLEAGINLIDTAPGYGVAEELVGATLRAFGGPVHVATKVVGGTHDEVRASIERSLGRLGRDRIDLVQIHNATEADLGGPTMEALVEARQRGEVERLGASVYGPGDALAAIRHVEVDVVQVAFNLLDQRASGLFLEAEARGVALLVRSALLKGVLTSRRRLLPERLARLGRAADRAERWARRYGLELTQGALRFCLSQREVGAVLVGLRDQEELQIALDAAAAGPLARHWLSDAVPLSVEEVELIDPRRWEIP